MSNPRVKPPDVLMKLMVWVMSLALIALTLLVAAFIGVILLRFIIDIWQAGS